MFEINSAAVSTNPLDKDFCDGTKKELDKWLIPYHNRAPVRLTLYDCQHFDYIICMDDEIKKIVNKFGGKLVKNKVFKLLDFTDNSMDILDPAVTKDFVRTYEEVSKGCDALFNHIILQRKSKALLIS